MSTSLNPQTLRQPHPSHTHKKHNAWWRDPRLPLFDSHYVPISSEKKNFVVENMRIFALYFGAYKDKQSKHFLKYLSKLYFYTTEHRARFEIILIPLDESEEDTEFFVNALMGDWLVLPWSQQHLRHKLVRLYQVDMTSLPRLVIVRNDHRGSVIRMDGKNDVLDYGYFACREWMQLARDLHVSHQKKTEEDVEDDISKRNMSRSKSKDARRKTLGSGGTEVPPGRTSTGPHPPPRSKSRDSRQRAKSTSASEPPPPGRKSAPPPQTLTKSPPAASKESSRRPSQPQGAEQRKSAPPTPPTLEPPRKDEDEKDKPRASLRSDKSDKKSSESDEKEPEKHHSPDQDYFDDDEEGVTVVPEDMHYSIDLSLEETDEEIEKDVEETMMMMMMMGTVGEEEEETLKGQVGSLGGDDGVENLVGDLEEEEEQNEHKEISEDQEEEEEEE